MPDINDNWLAVILGLAACGQLTFVLFYLTFPWWNSLLGRVLFTHAVIALFVLASAAAGLAWDWGFEYEVRFISYSALALLLWGQAYVFHHIRIRALREVTHE